MIFRPAVLADVPALATIEAGQPRCAQWKENGWKTELAEPSARVWCAEENGQIVGFLALRFVAGVGEILNVGVLATSLRRGIGRALMARALAWVRTQGGGQITLEVGVHNVPAVKLYEQAGFVQVGVRKNFYAGNEDALLLGKTV